ncbi:MAG: glycosyltransferase [Anaerolineales bacterium]|nr:glycosyltransferase [Anaerolineales bacterium]
MIFLLIFITLALIGMALIAIVNTLTFPRLRLASIDPSPAPCRLSVLIPARNEAAVIGQTVQSLLAQNYPAFEVILLDDNSTDRTATVARTAAQGDPRLRIIAGAPLPQGWLGKNWACHQLAQAASGEWLIFADADVLWSPGALSALAAEMNRTRADLLTIWPTQHTVTWGERLVVPLMALVILGYLPVLLVHHLPWPSLAAANGQCLAFRRQAYQSVSGHAALRDNILEDVNFARRIKTAGLRLRMADGAGLITCRMYPDWPSVRDGFAKNILAGYGGSVFFLALATVFHWLVFLFPWLAIFTIYDFALRAFGGFTIYDFEFTIHHLQFTIHNLLLLLIALGLGVRMLTAAVTRQRLGDALLLPVSVLLMTHIAVKAVWWHWRGGPRWKGRVIRQEGKGI